MKLKFKAVHSGATVPTYATDGSGCLDLRSVNHGVVKPYSKMVFSTGLAFEVPEGYAMFIFSRSGHGFNQGLRLSNCVGIIDSDYRGEVKVSLHADKNTEVRISAGDRIAQACLIQLPKVEFEEVYGELSSTERGANGFGSTGNG